MDSRPAGGLRRGESRFGFLLAVPALIAFSVTILYPLMRALVKSLYRDTLFTTTPVYVGLGNFQRIFQDPRLMQTWWITVIFVIGTTALAFVLGLVWALLLSQQFKGRAAIRAMSLLPWVIPSTVTGFLWAWLLNAQYGVVNAFLLRPGVIGEPIAWMATPGGAMAAVILARTWTSMPWFTALFLAGIQTLPPEQIEAARVDGAGNFDILRYVVLPHLRHVMMIVLILGAIGNLQLFDIIHVMTRGGPARATTVFSIEVYNQAFQSWNTGMASAIGVIWLLTIAVPAFFYLRSLFRQVAQS